ncbi:MAG: hypothetical protein DWQ34_05660 [Planctomycetota bacterium]|nr:MAG: hypothetical protein DWQ29_03850 [Planctomycetota bacterium]REJ95534.1 MAG: hypothetical protein DWQ34_05660 [Planctomycetota bacterium]REK21920.1 MAG: hypothetical protein DWQ41_20130 [Planctomycetota bacterium]REK32168.1 MAG: hypothetical protein DWQ45_17665 [Planctomycetota bacterium]
MMNTRVHITMVAAGCLAATMTGCGTAPTVFRAQEPAPEPLVEQTAFGTQPKPAEAIHDHYKYNEVLHYGNANGETAAEIRARNAAAKSHYTSHSHHAAACPACEDCPHCKGCPPQGQSCPFCQQGLGGDHDHDSGHRTLNKYPDHHFTYSYHRPKNLLYPPPQVPGGAVVWPYYTLKGPSDFFRTE